MASYCLGGIPNAIFWGKPVRFTATDFVDAILAFEATSGETD